MRSPVEFLEHRHPRPGPPRRDHDRKPGRGADERRPLLESDPGPVGERAPGSGACQSSWPVRPVRPTGARRRGLSPRCASLLVRRHAGEPVDGGHTASTRPSQQQLEPRLRRRFVRPPPRRPPPGRARSPSGRRQPSTTSCRGRAESGRRVGALGRQPTLGVSGEERMPLIPLPLWTRNCARYEKALRLTHVEHASAVPVPRTVSTSDGQTCSSRELSRTNSLAPGQ